MFMLVGILMAQLGMAGDFSFDYQIRLGEKPGSPFYQMTVKNAFFHVSKRSLLQPHENFEIKGSLSPSQRDLLMKVLEKIPTRAAAVTPSLVGTVALKWTVQGRSNSFQANSDQGGPALEDFYDFLEEFHRDTPELASVRPLLPGGQRPAKRRQRP